jgi:Kef-type K+ transport system membrane component KefB
MIESGKGSDVKFGNKLGFIILPFFIGMHSDPLDYVRKAKKVVDKKKSSLEVVFTHVAAEVILKVFGLKVIYMSGPLHLSTNGNM